MPKLGLFSQSVRPVTMNELAPAEKIQQLEQRHVRLIEELDALNERLEQALSSFIKVNDE